jgi:phosphonate transport system substrate-binding protein
MALKLWFLLFGLFFLGCEQKADKRTYVPSTVDSTQKVYVVGIHPYLNAQKTYHSYRPILNYLEAQIPHVKFKLKTSEDYAQYNDKLRQSVFDFSLPNPYQTVTSLSYKYRVIAKMKPDSEFRGILVARKDKHIQNVMQLKNNKVSFPAPTALAAAMMPLYYLQMEGLDIERDIQKLYVGSQFSSIMNAYSGDTMAGATWPTSWKDWCLQHPEKMHEMEVIWETPTLINNGFVVHERVPFGLAQHVAVVLSTLDEHAEGEALLKEARFDGFEIASDETYDSVIDFLNRYDETIGLPK